MTTLLAAARMAAASSAVALLTGRASLPAAAVACSCPKAPNRTLVNDRFIAFDMFTDRMKPDAPSSAPATISSLLSSTKPIAAAESPAYEFRSEITVGMSAPPIGMIISTPKSRESAMIRREEPGLVGMKDHENGHRRRPGARSERLTKFCPL